MLSSLDESNLDSLFHLKSYCCYEVLLISHFRTINALRLTCNGKTIKQILLYLTARGHADSQKACLTHPTLSVGNYCMDYFVWRLFLGVGFPLQSESCGQNLAIKIRLLRSERKAKPLACGHQMFSMIKCFLPIKFYKTTVQVEDKDRKNFCTRQNGELTR